MPKIINDNAPHPGSGSCEMCGAVDVCDRCAGVYEMPKEHKQDSNSLEHKNTVVNSFFKRLQDSFKIK